MKKILALVLVCIMVLPMAVFSVSAEAVTPDTSWYNATATEFSLSDAADLMGFAQIAKTEKFAGKTVKLTADIVLNEGDAAAWSSAAPANVWTPVTGFAGTFDGQGYSISGLYAVGASQVGFCANINNATFKNLSIVNSYFATTGSNNVAAFSATGGGDKNVFENCYTNATLVSAQHNAGGFIASVGACKESIFTNCWFDGSINIGIRYAAGICGNGEGKIVRATNCLNTGSIYSTYTEGNGTHIAGIVGRNDGTTVITNCLNVGKVSGAKVENGTNDSIGAIFGACSGNNQTEDKSAWISHVSIIDSWATTESCVTAIGANSSKDPSQVMTYGTLGEKLMRGYGAYVGTTLDFENVWAVDLDGTPRLQSFTPAEEIPPLYKVNAPVVGTPEVKLEGHYGPRWMVTLQLPEGIAKEDIKMGALIVPTKAIPANHDLNVADTAFDYRGNSYEVANVEAKIFRESEEGTLVASFVVTDLSAVNARMNFTCVPYVIYTVEGGATIEMYGNSETISFYQDTVLSLEKGDDAYKAQAEAVLAPIEKDLGGRFPVTEIWGSEDLFEEIPAMKVDNTEIVGSENYGDENYVIIVKGTVDPDYYAYLELLESFGFEKVYDNGEEGIEDVVYTATYAKGDLFVTVTQICYINQTYISATWNLVLSEHLEDKFSDDVKEGAVTSMHVNEMYNWGNSIVFKLNNGHFIVNDGATDDELPYLLDYLETLVPEGEIPVVDAWFFSHLHYDHCCVVRPFIKNPEWIERIRVNGFYFNEPSNAVKDLDPGVYGQIDEMKIAIGLLKTEDGGTPGMYRIQTGQRYYFSDIVVEVILGQEQVFFADYQGGFNESSSWLMYYIGDQKVVIGGDSHRAGMNMLMDSYDPEFLDMDIFFSLHHGSNTWQEFTDFCTFKTVIHPSTGLPGGANVAMGEKAVANGGEVLLEGGGTLVLTFPYEVGTSVKLPPKNWEYHGGNRVS